MIPFKDDNPAQSFPLITIIIIAASIVVFIIQMTGPSGAKQAVLAYGAIPHFLLTLKTNQPVHPLLTLFTSMFMHGGLLHLGTNMLFLWIFGNNIEDRLGYGKFIIFYLLCGAGAAYAHAISDPASTMPMIGASGAIAGILGAYVVLFPHARVHTLIFLGFFIQIVRLPAIFVIGLWIILQFVNVLLTKGIAQHGGVAWFAHIGGFILGILLIKLFIKPKKHRRAYY